MAKVAGEVISVVGGQLISHVRYRRTDTETAYPNPPGDPDGAEPAGQQPAEGDGFRRAGRRTPG